jgi:hypothetical protein
MYIEERIEALEKQIARLIEMSEPIPQGVEALPEILTTQDVAEFMGCSVHTVRRYLTEGSGPRCVRSGPSGGGRHRITKRDFVEWLCAQGLDVRQKRRGNRGPGRNKKRPDAATKLQATSKNSSTGYHEINGMSNEEGN